MSESRDEMENEDMSGASAPMTEEEIAAWHEKWDKPSTIPDFEGATPQDLARALLRPIKNENK